MPRLVLVVVALFIAFATVSASAQYLLQHATNVTASPYLASYDATHSGLSTEQADRVTILPLRSLYSGTPQDHVSYCLFYPAGASAIGEDLLFDGVNWPEPTIWNGTPSCGAGLRGWDIAKFTTAAAAMSFYDGTALGGLTTDQQKTAILYSAPGNQSNPADRFIVVYQPLMAFCH